MGIRWPLPGVAWLWWALALVVVPASARAEPGVRAMIGTLLGSAADPLVIAGATVYSAAIQRRLYAARAHEPLWTEAALRDLASAIEHAQADGLTRSDYLPEVLALRDLPVAARELLATEALARLAYCLRFGKANPQALEPAWNYSRSFGGTDPAQWLAAAIASGTPSAALAALRPAGSYYATLRAALAEFRALAAQGGWPAVPAGASLKPGMEDQRVSVLRRRLAIAGDLAPSIAAAEGLVYDPSLIAAVQAFQKRHGLAIDGVVGAQTLRELNVPVTQRIAQLRVNLERVRWVFRDLEPEFLVVNIAAFHAAYFVDGTLRWHGRVIVGRPYRQTPIFKASIGYLELNPTWTVPPTIFAKDILPELRRDPAYLSRKQLRVIDPNGGPVDASAIDWRHVAASRFPYLLRQAPGADNALGRIKFMFPNPHAVYLHDTPARELFERSERSFSSGCIRVERPLELAELLMRDGGRWDVAALEAAIATGRTQRIALPRKVTIMLLYLTAFEGPDGRVQFRRDVYSRDAKVLAALDGAFRFVPPDQGPPRAPTAAPPSIGLAVAHRSR